MEIVKRLLNEEMNNQVSVLATITGTKGSTYRKSGAKMVVNSSGEVFGQLSGGCIEVDLIERSLALIENKHKIDMTSYLNLTQPDPILGFDKGCKGDMHVLLLNIKRFSSEIQYINNALDRKERVLLGTIIDSKTMPSLIGESYVKYENKEFKVLNDSLSLDPILKETLKESMLNTGVYHDKNNEITTFTQVFYPAKDIIIVGAGNDVIPVVKMARNLSYQITLADFRPSLIHKFTGKCEEINILPRDLEEVKSFFQSKSRNIPIIIMSHDFAFDSLCLKSAMDLEFKYIGVMGPRTRLHNLLKETNSSEKGKIHCPIGLEIGAQTPDEIAISILSEIINYYSSYVGN
ncbi:hypothetical protein RW25_27730 [Bacillus sp. L_1B0_8]|uniref:XdhC family protein n=1 Tax=unclassified Bacillus (in: firmicutes) TaxID=185979 RepID=UPI0005B6DE70|nr:MULTISPECIES: XdhC family protein [unclassified Bacillus (in: firmicutes)]KIQ78523.1 hypothetical protein RW25_27730 [Bacillus sp. L_1B0_8]KIQ78636.1 hypothetical protein RT27_29360 [Bacillus sp. L_1B0_5]